MTKISTPPVYVRYTGLFDFDAFYAAMIDWMRDHRYRWHEETYKHKQPSPMGGEFEWKWYGTKKVTGYVHYRINIAAHMWDVSEVEVAEGKKRKKLTNGRFQIILKGEVTTDWQKKWEKNRFTRFLGRIYEEHIIRREIENVYFDNLWYRMWDLQTVMKKFFDMQTKWNEYKRYLGED